LEPLTHILTGACISRAGLNRKTGLATAMLAVAAEISDVDVLWGFRGPTEALQHHRGWTHSFVGVPAMAALALLLVWGWNRLFRRKRLEPGAPAGKRPCLPVNWRWLFALGCLGALSHILLDYTTAYGIRFLEPFSFHWYSWDIVSIIEPVLLLVLVFGLVTPSLFGLIHEEIGARQAGPRGRGGAIFALVAMVVVWGVRDFEHRHAVAQLDARLYHGAEPLRDSAYPYPWNPFRWHGVVETESFFETMIVDSLHDEVDPQGRARTYFKPPETPAMLAAKKTHFGRVYLDWTAYPYTEEEHVLTTEEYLVRFYDLRYRFTDSRRSPLAGTVVLDKNLNFVEVRFGIRSSRR
jgi:inner membrane protein